MPPKAKAKAKAKAGGRWWRLRQLPYQLYNLTLDRPMSDIADGYYTERQVSTVVEYLLECSTADLEYWLRLLTTYRPLMMKLIAPRFSAKRRREELVVNMRKRLRLTLAVQPNGVVRAAPSTE